jgi:hypothetical protein
MLRRLVLHPMLAAVYPVVFLYAQSLDEQVSIRTVFTPLLVCVTATGALFMLIWLLMRNAQKAALLTSIYVVLFFSFGHVKNVLVGPHSFVGELLLIAAWGILASVGTITTMRMKRRLDGLTMGLNVVSLVLVVMNVVPIVIYEFEDENMPQVAAPRVAGLRAPPDISDRGRRDIYYLIFDRYGNERTLSRKFDFNNEDFLGFLEEQGFYVAHDSAANYQGTAQSLASSLNLTYLDDLERTIGSGSRSMKPVFDRLRGFKAAKYLKSIGYRYYHLGSWWAPTSHDPTSDINYTYQSLSEFSNILLKSTLLSTLGHVYDFGDFFGESKGDKRLVLAQFEKLAMIESDPRPTFTFAHFLLPHPPYVFDRDGNPVSEEVLAERPGRESYIEQLIHTNHLIKEMASKLLDGPHENDPIVVIQSDEGPHPWRYQRDVETFNWYNATDSELRQKLLILNAYYFPSRGDALYDAISPVNTFRVMFNEYFRAGLPVLEDRTFVYKDHQNLYQFKEVTERLRNEP